MAARFTGADKVSKLMKRFSGPAMVREVGKALYAAGEMAQKEAQISITTGSAGGDSGGKHQHTPSRPGEAPNNHRGVLADSIEVHQIDALTVNVASLAPYSVALEFGTSKMAERPFMRPAAKKVRKKVGKLMGIAVSRASKGASL